MTALSTTISDLSVALRKAATRVDLSDVMSRQAERFVTERFSEADVTVSKVGQATSEVVILPAESEEVSS